MTVLGGRKRRVRRSQIRTQRPIGTGEVTETMLASGAVNLATKVTGLLPNANLATITDAVKIADALLSQSKIASGFKLWGIGASLPAYGNQGTMFFRTTDNTLWEDTGSAWKEIVRSGFAAYDHILALTVTGGLIVAGTIVGDKIAANTLNGNHMQLNSLLVTGTAQIADLIVGTTKVVDNAITNSGSWADDAESSTTSGSFTDLGSVTITPLGDRPVAVWAKLEAALNGGATGEYRLIHGQSGTQIDLNTFVSSDTYYRPMPLLGLYTPSATSTFTLQFRVSNGVGTVYARRKRLVVIELKK